MGECAQPQRELLLFDAERGAAALRAGHQGAQRVLGDEQERDQLGVDGQSLLAQARQHVLEGVRELLEVIQAEARGVALERVRVPEDVVDQRPVARVVLERDKAVLDRAEVLV
jgi:hypothetical protein